MKKGMEMTMNIIVVSAILLIVLFVLIAITTGRLNVFNRDIDSAETGLKCSSAGKRCHALFECREDEKRVVGNFQEIRDGKVCCCPE